MRLPGGNVGGAMLVAGTVRRPTGPWTPAVHELLGFLDDRGLPLIPRVLGVDERGREVLTYLPGRVVPIGVEALTDRQVGSAMAWLREYHRAVAEFPRTPRRWRFAERALAPGEIVCHHDVAMYNLAFDDDDLAGVFDWDVAGPGVPLDDLAIFAWNSPLLDPLVDADEAAHGLVVMARAYAGPGGSAPEGALRPALGRALDPAPGPARILEHVLTRMTTAADRISAGQRAGDAGMLRLGEIGEPAATRARIEVLRPRVPALMAALRGA